MIGMNRARIVVAVDDMPYRYTTLAQRLRPFGWALVVVEHPDALRDLLDLSPIPVLAVLLDHDLRPVWAGEMFGGERVLVQVDGKPWTRSEYRVTTGLDYAVNILAPRSVPVIVTSANRPGSDRICAVLRDAEVEHRRISCIEASPEDRWLAALAEWAARGER